MLKINKLKLISYVFITALLFSVGFVCGIFANQNTNISKKSESAIINNSYYEWIPKYTKYSKWAAAINISDKLQLILSTSPDDLSGTIKAVGYRVNNKMLIKHFDQDGDGELDQIQINDPVTGEMRLYMLNEKKEYRDATRYERDERIKEILESPNYERPK